VLERFEPEPSVIQALFGNTLALLLEAEHRIPFVAFWAAVTRNSSASDRPSL
jgi:hypothetical protein